MAQILDMRKTLLTQLKVPEEIKNYLDQITIPIVQEWAYLCAADGMGLDLLKKLCIEAESDTGKAGTLFSEEKRRFLRDSYENNIRLEKQVIDLHGKVETMYQRAASVEGTLEETIRKALRDKDELYGKIIEARNDLIREKELQIKHLEEEVLTHKDNISRISVLLDKLKKQNDSMESGPGSKDNTPKSRVTNAEEKEEFLLSSEDTHANRYDTSSYPYSEPGFLSKIYRWKKEKEAVKFIRRMLENNDFSEEQKEYLLVCLEEGLPLEMIQKMAIPNISIRHMKWIRRMLEEGRYAN